MAIELHEKDFAQQIGIPVGEVRRLRGIHLSQEDWRPSGKSILLSENGQKKIKGALELAAAVVQECPRPAPGVTLIVRKLVTNPRVLLAVGVPDGWQAMLEGVLDPAKVPGAFGELPERYRAMILLAAEKKEPAGVVTVRVRDAAKFVPGMVLAPCRAWSPSVYTFEGRCPRFKGKW